VSTGLRNGATALTGAVTVVTTPQERTDGWPKAIYAARIVGGASVGTWGVGDPQRMVGLLLALNGPAQKYSSWGSAARPGSVRDRERRAAAESGSAAKAESCVK
jgi:hypothetical protein